MGAKVFTIERQRKLYDRTKTLLQELGYTSIKTYYGDGFEGLPTYAPFDKIIITAGASEVPVKLIDQLKINGGMIIPYGDQVQKMKRITKKPEGLQVEDFDDFTFVPMLHGKVQQ
jgi:protein-L-isoaspartate(D-aspartate) O-methyltransferase